MRTYNYPDKVKLTYTYLLKNNKIETKKYIYLVNKGELKQS